MLSLNAGFIIWLCDTRFNPSDFPRPFPQGALEGGWWAFVSMTTVGYGDKCPKFALARIFAIIWIVFGIAISGIFTASITTALTVSLSTEKVDLGRKKIGVLNVTRYEHNIALREKAYPKEFNKLEDMKMALKSGSVDGLLIDNNVLGYNWNFLKSGMDLEVKTNIANSDTTYGIMFQTMNLNNDTKKMEENQVWATFLSAFFDYNKDNENIMLALAAKSLPREISREPFIVEKKTTGLPESVYTLLFQQIGYSSVAFLLIGIIYEVVRRVCNKKKIDLCGGTAQVSGTNNTKGSNLNGAFNGDVEMDAFSATADSLVHELEDVLTKVKALKLKAGKLDTRM
ncbi:uncharacterized protein LOC135690768 [Rhopilema esculentum]|uniref:uncharacterized protein LOC135690768 n=1 Tax=Rhopilema esculentum TaxID=499914 RepID=UPI0031D8E39F